MSRKAVGVVVVLSLLALPVSAYQVCWETMEIYASGGCVSWTTCNIYDDDTGEYKGTIRGPFQQCG